ncbi:g6714 [Coccomyxa viridis]|uniref:G6714 protein n=1 Tax=Coccomyxa viridis TaxID=1274662 RepID=A0ABP1FW22_9CHLO
MKAAYAVLTIVVMSAAARGRHLMSEQPSGALAKRLAVLARDNTVVLTLASCGYLDFADNWITHVEALGISNWLTVAQDAAALQYLSERQAQSASMYPGHVLPISDFTGETLGDGSDLLEWGTSAFSVMACKRPLYLQAVLDLGYSVIWSDMDAVWLRDFHTLAPSRLDVVLVDDSESEEERRSDNTGTGLMRFNPTEKAKGLLRDWHQVCQDEESNAQPAWNKLFTPEKRDTLAFHIMTKEIYPHSVLLSQFNPSKQRSFSPAWVHANFQLGAQKKQAFLAQHSVWKVEDVQEYPTCAPVTDLFVATEYPWQAHERLAARAVLKTMGVVSASMGNDIRK